MNIAEIFDEVADKMRSDAKQTRLALNHPGMKGSCFEELFRAFLRTYLPRSIDVSTGILVDSCGRSTRQLDVILSDANRTPVLYRQGDIRVIPVECVYSVIEVKAYLDAEELGRIFQNMLSVRSLEKEAYIRPAGQIINFVRLYGKDWDIWPTNYFVFAFDSIDLQSVAEHVASQHASRSLEEPCRVDCICVLDKGVVCNQLVDGTFKGISEPGSKLFTCKTSRALLLFYTLISPYVHQSNLPSFDFGKYLGAMSFD